MKKKPLILALVLALAAASGFFFLRNPAGAGGPRRDPATLLPATTCLFVHLPDLPRTIERWRSTSLHDIASEPQWQEFVQHLPPDLETQLFSAVSDKTLLFLYQQWRALDPVEIFLAEPMPGSPFANVAVAP